MKRYLAEFIGTFAIVFCGTGAVVINLETGGVQIGHLGIAITFGLVVTAMIHTWGGVSGAHFNPAVTLSLWFVRLFSAKDILPYVASQIAGGLLASAILKLMFPQNLSLGATLPRGSTEQSFVLELILTYLLMLVILFTSQGKEAMKQLAGITIGATVLCEALFGGPISGASMNPARSIAPALVSGNIHTLWVYVLAPILGCLLATATWKLMREPS